MLPIHAPYGAFLVFGSGTRRLPCGQYELVCCAIGFANTRNGMAMCSPPTRGLRAYAMHGKRALKRRARNALAQVHLQINHARFAGVISPSPKLSHLP